VLISEAGGRWLDMSQTTKTEFSGNKKSWLLLFRIVWIVIELGWMLEILHRLDGNIAWSDPDLNF
jgi:hypothetical protein